MNLFISLIKKVKKIDIFALGPSSFLFYVLIFFMAPFLVLMGAFFGLKMFDYGALNYRSLLYLAIGFVTLALGYYSFFGKRFARKIPQIFKSDWRSDRVSWVFGVTFILGILAKVAQFLTGGYFFSGRAAATWKYISLYGVLDALHFFSLVALIIAFLWYYHLKKKGDENYKVWRNVAWGTLIFIILYSLPMCSKQHIMTPITLVLIVRWYALKRSYVLIMLTFLGMLLLFPYSGICRSPAALVTFSIIRVTTVDEMGELAGGGKPTGGEGLYEYLYKDLYRDYYGKSYEEPPGTQYNVDIGQAISFTADSFLGRISQHKVFQAIMENPQPLLYGRPFLSFFVSLGPPRVMWKSKPIITPDGNAFGRNIGIISPQDFKTFIGATNVGDWYMNFGLPGIIFGMFLIGAVFRFIYDYLITRPKLYLSGVMIYIIVWTSLIKGMEHAMAPLYAGTVKLVVILVVVHIALSWGKEDFTRVMNRFRRIMKPR